MFLQFCKYCTVAHKSHDPCFHKKYMEAGVMTFVTHCTWGAAANTMANLSNFFIESQLY